MSYNSHNSKCTEERILKDTRKKHKITYKGMHINSDYGNFSMKIFFKCLRHIDWCPTSSTRPEISTQTTKPSKVWIIIEENDSLFNNKSRLKESFSPSHSYGEEWWITRIEEKNKHA